MILRRLQIFVLVLIALVATGSLAQGARQEVLEKELTISLKDVTLKQALQQIETVAKVKFVYSRSYLNLDEKVSVEAAGKKLGQVLEELLTPREIRFSVHETNNFVVLTQAKARGSMEFAPGMQDVKAVRVTGVVKDVAGQPIAGVNIVEKGTTNGTSTDASGAYGIETSDNGTLVFSFIGFRPVEQLVGGRTLIDVTMEEDQSVLDAVLVNAGYWQVSEREQTGSISRITSKEIQQQPVGNPLAALIGRMPGVNVQQQSGIPGSGFTVQIRGRNSLRLDGNDPLYVIDGVPISSASATTLYSPMGASNPLVGINPADIETIEVLKDADATAIYGTRGANGVILITTKKGGPGKTKLDLNVYSGVGKVSRFMKLLNTEQYMNMRREALRNDGLAPEFYDYDLLGVWDTTRYTDWQKELIGGTSNITNAQLAFSGGSENTSFSLSSGFYKETTVMPGEFGNKKVNTHFALNHRSENKKFEIGVQATYVVDMNSLPYTDLTQYALSLPPVAPKLYNEDGKINWANSTWPGFYNPIAYTLVKFSGQSQNLVSNLRLGYEILPGLTLRSSFGYTTMRLKETSANPIEANDPAFGITTGSTDFGASEGSSWIMEPQMEYQRKIARGSVSILLGNTLQQSIRESQSIRASGFSNDSFLENLQSATAINVIGTGSTQYKYSALFGRINYNFKERYLINLTGRRDGSSRFGQGRQFSNFGAAGLAWIFSEEGFLKGSSLVSFGKIRTSYGITGSDQIPDYGFLDSYASTTYPYQGRSGLIPTRLANPDYSWETTRKFEAALDLGFFKDRISISAAYYQNRSSNQLVGYSLSRVTGFSSVQYNLPATVQNTGAETILKTTNFATSHFEWSTSLSVTVPRTKLIDYPGLAASSDASKWELGKPLNAPKTLKSKGVDPETGLYEFDDIDQNGSGGDYPGDLVVTKTIGQNWYGGLNNHLRYKGFELDVFLQFVDQTARNNLYNIAVFYNPGGMSNQPVEVMNRWQKPGDKSEVQKFSNLDGYYTYLSAGQSDLSISATSYFRVKNIALSYTFPKGMLSSAKIQNVRIYLQGQNLYTATKSNVLDPEQPFINSMPALRYLTAGLQVSI